MSTTATDPALAECRLFVATPVYDGAQGRYVRSIIAFAQAAQAQGLSVEYDFNLYQASITRARNILVARFLASDATHLLFLDSDIEFTADDLLSMVRAMHGRADCGVLGGPYPRRQINWHNVARAAQLGLGRNDPADLARYAGDFVLKLLKPEQSFALNELVELELLGTGLMLIRRDVIEGLCARHPGLAYRPEEVEKRACEVGDIVPTLFYPLIEPGTQALYSDDYAFCRRVRDAGYRIWLAPWVRTSHSGPAIFDAALADLAHLAPQPSDAPAE